MSQDLYAYLKKVSYPGRGIVLGNAAGANGSAAVTAYWIMGRSANSRNRVFTRTEDGIRTEAQDPAKLEDPSLIIYHPVRQVGDRLIVTNGDQTDTIQKQLLQGGSFADALRTRTFEPDAPNWTPRISGLLNRNGSYTLSILKASANAVVRRQFFEYLPEEGLGHFISTYQGDGTPLPSFSGEPMEVSIDTADARVVADQLWDALNEENRVSLFVRCVELQTGCCETVVKNKYGDSWAESAGSPIWN